MEPSTNVVAGRLRKLSQLSIGFKQAHKRIREVVLSQKMMGDSKFNRVRLRFVKY
jgi:hypothetical protein